MAKKNLKKVQIYGNESQKTGFPRGHNGGTRGHNHGTYVNAIDWLRYFKHGFFQVIRNFCETFSSSALFLPKLGLILGARDVIKTGAQGRTRSHKLGTASRTELDTSEDTQRRWHTQRHTPVHTGQTRRDSQSVRQAVKQRLPRNLGLSKWETNFQKWLLQNNNNSWLDFKNLCAEPHPSAVQAVISQTLLKCCNHRPLVTK